MTKSLLILIVLALSLVAASALATEAPSLEHGKTLFESPELGAKQRSCASCHDQGKGLDKIGDFNDVELKDIINACIRDALSGNLLDVDSQEMNALLSYVRMYQKH